MSQLHKSMSHNEALMLLPWLVNGTLSESERDLVSTHADNCSVCREEIRALNAMNNAVNRQAATPMLPKADPTAVLQQITEKPVAQRPGRLPLYAAAAAAAVLVIAIVVLRSDPALDGATETPLLYETATSGTSAEAMAYVIRMQLSPELSASERRKLFEFIAAVEVVDEGGGIALVTVKSQAAALSAVQDYTRSIEAIDGVISAEIVEVRLPGQER